VWCLCSPLSTDASSQCDRFLEAQHYKQVDHIPKEGSDDWHYRYKLDLGTGQ